MGKGKGFSWFQHVKYPHVEYPPQPRYKLPDKRPTQAEIDDEAFTTVERPRISPEEFQKIKGMLSKDPIDPKRWELTECDIYLMRAGRDMVRQSNGTSRMELV